MISFKKWLEFSDQGGEVSYNHMNNVAADDGFGQLRSKWMAPQQKKEMAPQQGKEKRRKSSKYTPVVNGN
jgi:hypothetical protein